MAPGRRGDISEVALRAVVNGNVAGFLTACIAGKIFKHVNAYSCWSQKKLNTIRVKILLLSDGGHVIK